MKYLNAQVFQVQPLPQRSPEKMIGKVSIAGPVSPQTQIDFAGTAIYPDGLVAGQRPRRLERRHARNIRCRVQHQPTTIICCRLSGLGHVWHGMAAVMMTRPVSISHSGRSAPKYYHSRQRDGRSHPHDARPFIGSVSPGNLRKPIPRQPGFKPESLDLDPRNALPPTVLRSRPRIRQVSGRRATAPTCERRPFRCCR